MLQSVHPKLPMRNKVATRDFYVKKLGFEPASKTDYDGYLMLKRDGVELHFFEFMELVPADNYGQVYIRTNDIEALYASFISAGAPIHPNAPLETKPWGQKEFSVLDPDNNLLTFGQTV